MEYFYSMFNSQYIILEYGCVFMVLYIIYVKIEYFNNKLKYLVDILKLNLLYMYYKLKWIYYNKLVCIFRQCEFKVKFVFVIFKLYQFLEDDGQDSVEDRDSYKGDVLYQQFYYFRQVFLVLKLKYNGI